MNWWTLAGLVVGAAAGAGGMLVLILWVDTTDRWTTLRLALGGRQRDGEAWGFGYSKDVPHTLPDARKLTGIADDRHEMNRVWAELS